MINKIHCGDCMKIMKNIDNNSVDLVVTSPPYDKLRNYEGYTFKFENIVKELYRVVSKGGIVVWVVGDSTINGTETGNSFKQALFFNKAGFNIHDTMIYEKNSSSFPARRNGNRYSQIFEYMFVFSKGKPKTTNLICDKKNRWAGWVPWGKMRKRTSNGLTEEKKMSPVPEFSPRNNIWKYSTGAGYTTKDKFAFQHPAIFPEQLAEDHIKSWSNEGDLVLDPMCGSGTTCKMAKLNNRNFIGIDVSEKYVKLSNQRVQGNEVIKNVN